jgi:ubiquinone/menaquinone biosynthesis C-methylase UbiE
MLRAPNFDRIARPYRWLEYLSFGPLLERCRFAHLPQLADAKHALVLGDGDGRFLARLLARNPQVTADVVDISTSMLALSRARAAAIGADARACFHHADARKFPPPANSRYDLIVTNFFLDCLSDSEIAELVDRLLPYLNPGGRWLVSEFAVPTRGPARQLGRLLIRSLYFAFRCLTGLHIRQLPDYASILRRSGRRCEDAKTFLAGILRSELWRRS